MSKRIFPLTMACILILSLLSACNNKDNKAEQTLSDYLNNTTTTKESDFITPSPKTVTSLSGISEDNGDIPLIYDGASDFSEGLALVMLDGKCGFVDKTGSEVVPLKYDYADDFSDGLAIVMLDEKYGFVDKTGNEVIPLIYEDANSFSEGLAGVYSDDYGGFIDKSGTVVVPFKYGLVTSFQEGMAIVIVGTAYDGKWGFINKEGNEIVPPKYSSAGPFSDGLAHITNNDNIGVIDKTGKEIISLGKYSSIFDFSEGLASVNFQEQWGYIDTTGKEVVTCKYGWAWFFSEGLAAVCFGDFNHESKWGYIDKNGVEIIPPKYDYFPGSFCNGVAAVSIDGKYSFIDKTGNEMIPFGKYDRVYDFSEGAAIVEFGGKSGFIDTKGNEIIAPILEFDSIAPVSNGMALVSLGDKYGFISVLSSAFEQSELSEQPELSIPEQTLEPAAELQPSNNVGSENDQGTFINLNEYIEEFREEEMWRQSEIVIREWNYTPEYVMDSRIVYNEDGVRGIYWYSVKDDLDAGKEVILRIGYGKFALYKEYEPFFVDGFLDMESTIETLSNPESDSPEPEIPDDILEEVIRRTDEYFKQNIDKRIVLVDGQYGIYSNTLIFIVGSDVVEIGGRYALKIYEGTLKIVKL